MTHAPAGYMVGKVLGERKRSMAADTIVAFSTAISLFTSLSWSGLVPVLSSPERPCLSGKAMTFPILGEGILIGETDSNSLILC